jgi:hypothetical protein
MPQEPKLVSKKNKIKIFKSIKQKLIKKKFSTFAAIALKATIITGCIMYGFSANAQSIAGKWKMTKEICLKYWS